MKTCILSPSTLKQEGNTGFFIEIQGTFVTCSMYLFVCIHVVSQIIIDFYGNEVWFDIRSTCRVIDSFTECTGDTFCFNLITLESGQHATSNVCEFHCSHSFTLLSLFCQHIRRNTPVSLTHPEWMGWKRHVRFESDQNAVNIGSYDFTHYFLIKIFSYIDRTSVRIEFGFRSITK